MKLRSSFAGSSFVWKEEGGGWGRDRHKAELKDRKDRKYGSDEGKKEEIEGT